MCNRAPTYDYDPDLTAHNLPAIWDAQEDERILAAMATRRVDSYLRDNNDILSETPNRQVVFNGRFVEEYRSESDFFRVVADPEGGQYRFEVQTLVTYSGSGVARQFINSEAANSVLDFGLAGAVNAHAFWDQTNTRFTIGTIGPDEFYLRTDSQVAAVIDADQFVSFANGTLKIGSGGTLTIASGEVTPTHSFHTIDTESAAATDDLDTISVAGVPNGAEITLCTLSDGRDVTIKHGTGNIWCGSDRLLAQSRDVIKLVKFGGDWRLVSYANNVA